jgi:hypothetical protein
MSNDQILRFIPKLKSHMAKVEKDLNLLNEYAKN